MAAIQFLGMLAVFVLFLVVVDLGFFETGIGRIALIIGCLVACGVAYFFIRKNKSNQRALKGSKGYITGKASRVDERTIVFARNKLHPGTDQYKIFYQDHPGLEAIDKERRAKGKTLGKYGSIDSPYEKPNVSIVEIEFEN
ncbi:MAG: hypothetical protein ABFS43_10765 [Thermodesulfobacteriota bacterium]